MKKYTQEEFDSLPVNKYGTKECPTGDYTQIHSFGEWCSFGLGCSFGDRCIFGLGCSFGDRCIFGLVCSFGEWCKAISPYWPYVYEPPFEIDGVILPTLDCKDYWIDKLNIPEISDLCFNDALPIIRQHLPRLLSRKIWSKCDQRILESWR